MGRTRPFAIRPYFCEPLAVGVILELHASSFRFIGMAKVAAGASGFLVSILSNTVELAMPRRIAEAHVRMPGGPVRRIFRAGGLASSAAQAVIPSTTTAGSFAPSTKSSTFSITRSSNVSGQLAPLVRMMVTGRSTGSQPFVRSSLCAG